MSPSKNNWPNAPNHVPYMLPTPPSTENTIKRVVENMNQTHISGVFFDPNIELTYKRVLEAQKLLLNFKKRYNSLTKNYRPVNRSLQKMFVNKKFLRFKRNLNNKRKEAEELLVKKRLKEAGLPIDLVKSVLCKR